MTQQQQNRQQWHRKNLHADTILIIDWPFVFLLLVTFFSFAMFVFHEENGAKPGKIFAKSEMSKHQLLLIEPVIPEHRH